MANRLLRYFSRYPGRTGGLASLLFRRGEQERFEVLQQWVPNCTGRSILDAGCGDGEFLQRLLNGRPAYIHLEDVVPGWVAIAGERLHDAAETVEPVVTDIRTTDDTSRYDIVLALGVFDYETDWTQLFRQLIQRTGGVLLTDFPKRGTWHSCVRRAWLRTHGLHLHAANRSDIESLVQVPQMSIEIVELPLQWVVKCERET